MIFKKKLNSGFTLVELLVTITIFVILTGVVLFSQSKFNSSILLTNLAYDTALTIRQAQNFGVNVKEFGVNTFSPYGVHFETGADKSFILYTDRLYSKTDNIAHPYPAGYNLGICDASKGCVNRYSIKRGNYIEKLCVNSDCDKTVLDIAFKRPNLDAIITSEPLTAMANIQTAKIILKGADGSARTVLVQPNGLIQVGE